MLAYKFYLKYPWL